MGFDMQRPELLVPAGNLEKLRTAVLYGADAVYVGIPGLSLRPSSAELSPEGLATAIQEAHAEGVKVYGALNTFARDRDLPQARRIVPDLNAMGMDGAIVSDPGLIRLIRSLAPELPLHLSTQANTTNQEAVRFWRDQGVSRIILARELNLREIGEMAAAVPEMELEVFVHGAMCMSYSGRCYLSAYRNRRSANAGDCSQPCRWEYLLCEATRPGNPLILEEDERFSYLLSSKDLCLIGHLPEVAASGVSSVKIEGRMKSSYYLAVVTRAYRQALDALAAQKEERRFDPAWEDELATVSNRGYTTGFAFAEEKITETSPDLNYTQTPEPAGIVLSHDPRQRRLLLEVRNHLRPGDQLDLLLPDRTVRMENHVLIGEDGVILPEAHSGCRIAFPCDDMAPVGALVRKKRHGA
jgi:putative protease